MTIVPASRNIGGPIEIAGFSGVLKWGGSPPQLRGQRSQSCNYPSPACIQLSLLSVPRSSLMMSFIIFPLCCTRFWLGMLPLGAGTSFRLFVAPPGSGSLRVGDNIDPLRVRHGLGVIVVVPVPPFVRRRLRIAF